MSTRAAPGGWVILLIDDDPSHRSFLGRTLGYVGYRVLVASSGLEGLALARRERPDLVLLDLMMPGMSGFEVAERLREEGFDGSIVFISARDEAEVFERAEHLGMPLLVKPVDLDTLLSAVAWGVRPPP